MIVIVVVVVVVPSGIAFFYLYIRKRLLLYVYYGEACAVILFPLAWTCACVVSFPSLKGSKSELS